MSKLFDDNQCSFLQYIINGLIDSNEISNNRNQRKFADINSFSIDTIKRIWEEVLFLKQKLELIEENDNVVVETKEFVRNNKKRNRIKSPRLSIPRASNYFQHSHISDNVNHGNSNHEV